jgi:orotate phosphoribosyltransferase
MAESTASGGGCKQVTSVDNGESSVGREKLLDVLVTNSYRRADSDVFELTSGRRSNYYIDCKATTALPEALPLIAGEVLHRIPQDADAVGGLTLGADPIACATAYRSPEFGRHIPWFVVRKESKKHGLKKYVEGYPIEGRKVVVVDDVVTTGGSTIEAIRKVRDAGARLVAVVALVDREEGGMEAIAREAGEDVPVRAVFRRSDLERRWQSTQQGARSDVASTRYPTVER